MTSDSKVALITGSSSGIGEATAKLLAREGYRVVICGSRRERVARVSGECAELSPLKHQPLELVLDFNVAANGEEAVKRTVQHFGRLDVLVNNAGVYTRVSGVHQNGYETYRRIMTINTDSTVSATLAAVEHLVATKGNIVFVSSVAGIKPHQSGYAYCMSKAAMTMFAKCLAIDVASLGVRVNTVSPGPVATPIFEGVGVVMDKVDELMGSSTLQNRVGQVDEIANAIAYLISDKASFVQGHDLVIDGGYLIKPNMHEASEPIHGWK